MRHPRFALVRCSRSIAILLACTLIFGGLAACGTNDEAVEGPASADGNGGSDGAGALDASGAVDGTIAHDGTGGTDHGGGSDVLLGCT